MLYERPNPFASIIVQGKDPKGFLQGLITADIRSLSESSAIPTCFCQYMGKVITFGLISQSQNALYLHIPINTKSALLTHLAPYAALNKIELLPTHDLNSVGLLSEQPLHLDTPFEAGPLAQDLHLCCLSQAPFIYLLYGPKEPLDLWLEHQDAHPMIEEVWNSALIQAQWPIIEANVCSQFTPNMLALADTQAVSMQKGCYLGQEIIARTYHLGKAKKTLAVYYCHDFKGELPSPGSSLDDQAGQQRSCTVLKSAMFESTLWLQVVIPTHPNFIPYLKDGEAPAALTRSLKTSSEDQGEQRSL